SKPRLKIGIAAKTEIFPMTCSIAALDGNQQTADLSHGDWTAHDCGTEAGRTLPAFRYGLIVRVPRIDQRSDRHFGRRNDQVFAALNLPHHDFFARVAAVFGKFDATIKSGQISLR